MLNAANRKIRDIEAILSSIIKIKKNFFFHLNLQLSRFILHSSCIKLVQKAKKIFLCVYRHFPINCQKINFFFIFFMYFPGLGHTKKNFFFYFTPSRFTAEYGIRYIWEVLTNSHLGWVTI